MELRFAERQLFLVTNVLVQHGSRLPSSGLCLRRLVVLTVMVGLAWGLSACSREKKQDVTKQVEPEVPSPTKPEPVFRIIKAEATRKPQQVLKGMSLSGQLQFDRIAPLRGSTFLVITYEVETKAGPLSYADDDFSLAASGIKAPDRLRPHASEMANGYWAPGVSKGCQKAICTEKVLFTVPAEAIAAATMRFGKQDYAISSLLTPAKPVSKE